ncbi:50S ribosomal protein L7ae-like protein [Texcoconibacillus texcoconensis]|uniref:RNA-binding protein HNQ41_003217 n=1 Tax=Texcoconibacillus texcoconensis TaxID=1095777 RepID=A0A840QTZ2_9BACI|nr:50S ribosomal protein L7ae-like protein [Texcoconibacillus texcoconensis]MBB5174992.1 large subunit ribosomal protein L7A [Texcoconibacillus texcoconensis]
MSYEKVAQADQKLVGTKQTLKALEDGKVTEVVVAEDIDEQVKQKIFSSANRRGVPIVTVDSMKKLGKACGIDVGAATVALKK